MGEQIGGTLKENRELKEEETGHETEIKDNKHLDSVELASDEEKPEEFDMEEMYEQSMKQIQEGELISGEIIKIEDDFVLVDIGYKSEGVIRINEFRDPNGNISAHVGDKVDVVLENRENDEGLVILSMERAKKIKVWDQIRDIYNNDGTIKGKVINRVKGGLSVDIGLPAFLPGSQIDLQPIRNLDSLVGQEMEFKVLKYNKRRNNIIVSRRAILESERIKHKAKTLSLLEEGAVLTGRVKNITDYGLFVDLGGIDGLLHITDMSWGRVSHPSTMYQRGDKITVKVINFDRERERVSLGLKQLKPDPWADAPQKYPVGEKVIGQVVNLTDYGAFIQIEEGVEGLIHISEMSWTKKIKHPSQIIGIGDTVEAVVLNLDTDSKRVSLGIKQIKPNPWYIIAEKYPVGTIIEGRIKNITDFGLFIGIDEDIDGLVHISDISWTKKIRHPSELYKKGDEVQAKVLAIDKDNERFSLGIKQLTKDPWEEIPMKYSAGTKVTGKVTNITDFGIFVELEEGVEGLVHSSEVSKGKSKPGLGKFQIDDVIQSLVVNVSKQEKKIGLSIKKLQEKEYKDIYSSYRDGAEDEFTSNFGMLIKEKIGDSAALNLQKGEEDTDTEDKEVFDTPDTPDEETEPADDISAEERDSLNDTPAEDSGSKDEDNLPA